MLAHFARQRVSDHEMRRDMKQRELNICHVDRARVDIDRGDMQVALIVYADIAHGLCERDHHRSCATGWLHGGHEAMVANDCFDAFGIVDGHLGHESTERIGCEELARAFL